MEKAEISEQIEFTTPRPYILGSLFLCGIITGFVVFHSLPPAVIVGTGGTEVEEPPPSDSKPSKPNRDVPDIADVEPPILLKRHDFQTMDLPVPQAGMLLEGGMTGKTATISPRVVGGAAALPPAPANPLHPPIPELTP